MTRHLIKHPRVDESHSLAPTEVAFLAHGNLNFALIVLIFDLLHFEIKGSEDPENIEQLSERDRYWESKLKAIFHESLKDWTKKKVQEIVIVDPRANPLGFMRRLPVLYRLISKGLRDSIEELLQDPRQIKKYFSMQGLLLVLAEISASGYKQKFQEELVSKLTAQRLLLTGLERGRYFRICLGGFLLCQLLFLTLILLAVPGLSHWHALILFAVALVSAALVKAALKARSFIPLYEELHNVLRFVPRRNFRVRLLEAFLSLINCILSALAMAVFCLLLALVAGLLYVSQIVTSWSSYFMLLAMFLAQLSVADWFFEACRVSLNSSIPSPLAEMELAKLRDNFASSHATALTAVKTMLLERKYDRNVAYLLAVYGPETLFFL